MQQFLKPTAGVARATIIPPELFEEFLVPVHDALATLYAGFGRESFPTFTRRLETKIGRGVWAWYSWHTSSLEIRLKWDANYSHSVCFRVIPWLTQFLHSPAFICVYLRPAKRT